VFVSGSADSACDDQIIVNQGAGTKMGLQVSLKSINYLKAVFTALMAAYGIICARNPAEFHFLDRVNLIAHEAGHLFFGWFGEFIMVLGGTIGQLFVPAALTGYFYLRREFFSAAVTFFWVGQNFLNISVYAKDAQAMALPLVSIGGGDAIHDWHYILTKVGLLRWDQAVGNTWYSIGVVIIVAAVICGFSCSFQQEESETV